MTDPAASPSGSQTVLLAVSWLILVIIPLLYGVVELVVKLGALFG